MRRSLVFCGFTFGASLLLTLLLYSGQQQALRAAHEHFPADRQLAAQLGLTDLAIWSEARYTRHPSQADLFTAFQDYPGAFDHFPAGSIIAPASPQLGTRLRIQKRGQP